MIGQGIGPNSCPNSANYMLSQNVILLPDTTLIKIMLHYEIMA